VPGVTIRAERPEDEDAVRRVEIEAFERADEADLVEALREGAAEFVSFVAVDGDEIAGHVLFTEVELEADADVEGLGLAPLAVLPSHQSRGIGTALVEAALEHLAETGIDFVVVLGDPAYYERFGFVPAATYGLGCVYDAPPEAFQALELREGALTEVAGIVRYRREFGG
jgi:putative acetyltransferase